MKRSKFFVLLMFVFLVGYVSAFDMESYDYKLSVTPVCSEYMGHVKFEFPEELGEISQPSIYSEDSIFVDESVGGKNLKRVQDWYVNSIPGYGVREIESVFDGDFGSDLVMTDSGVKIAFQNPVSSRVDKIIIDTKDSLISSFVISENGNQVPYDLKKDKFHYELDLNEFFGDEIDVGLSFDGVLKLREVSFFEEVESDAVTHGYFYVDDDCNRTREIYFGRFGESRFSRGVKSLPVFFDVEKKLLVNSMYDNDFDDDGVLNGQDNCLDVANADQKDIDYNEVGDACDDFDRDGVLNVNDNCPKVSNRNQDDFDGDEVGDACDEEDDRFFEKNTEILIFLVIVIVGAFGFLTYKIVKH